MKVISTSERMKWLRRHLIISNRQLNSKKMSISKVHRNDRISIINNKMNLIGSPGRTSSITVVVFSSSMRSSSIVEFNILESHILCKDCFFETVKESSLIRYFLHFTVLSIVPDGKFWKKIIFYIIFLLYFKEKYLSEA